VHLWWEATETRTVTCTHTHSDMYTHTHTYNSLSFLWTTITWRACHVWLCNASPILLSFHLQWML